MEKTFCTFTYLYSLNVNYGNLVFFQKIKLFHKMLQETLCIFTDIIYSEHKFKLCNFVTCMLKKFQAEKPSKNNFFPGIPLYFRDD